MKITAVSTLLAGLLLSAGSFAEPSKASLTPKAEKSRKVYIVQLADKPLAAYEGSIPGLAATKPSKNQKINLQSTNVRNYAGFLASRRQQALAAVPGARKIYDYKVAFNGFAAQMTPKEAEALRARKDVLGVWEDRLLKPHTNSTPDFLGLTGVHGPWLWGVTGEDVVIGVIDSGIHPEHPSVADVPTPKRGDRGRRIPYDAAPESFTGTGCDFGNTDANGEDQPFECNNKLLKAQSFSDAFLNSNTLADYEFLSARDAGGHGTHTATTAGGNYGVAAEIDGEPAGTVSGMAPRARIAVYKVCWDAPDPDDSGCFSSDSMAAIDQAVADGVDVINFSIGGPSTTFNGPDDIAFLFAADAGVFVSVSAGNEGPGPETIGTPSGAPWVTSVAAAEDDESFGTGLRVDAPAEIAATYEGLEGSGPVSLADSGAISAAVVAAEPLEACTPLANSDAMAGQIALVIRGGCPFSTKYNEAAAAGAQAIVVYNDGTAPDRVDPLVMSAPDTTIPGIMIRHMDGALIAETSDTAGTLSPEIQIARVDRIAEFSSRGANAGAPDIIKPDVTAPGVGIIAGTSPVLSGGNLFDSKNGTSMSSPHVAGIMALLKQVHPDWTPAMAKSALMTTARTNLRKSFGPEAADPFDMGAGMVQATSALFPGLVYDAGLEDYSAFLCGAENQPEFDFIDCDSLASQGYSFDSSDLNLASIAVGELVGSQAVTRKVTNVAPGPGWYWAWVDAPEGVDVQVSPRFMHLREGETASYTVTFTATDSAVFGDWAFGSLTWSSLAGFHSVRSPIAVRPVPISAPAELAGSGTDGSLSFDVQFGYNGAYQVNINGLAEGAPFPGAVEDGENNLIFFDIPEGTNLARVALFDEDVGAGDGSDDLDLQVFGPGPDFPFVGSSGTPTSQEEVNIPAPAAGQYAVFVIDFASAAGPTPYTLFNFNLTGDAGNTVITAPAAEVGNTDSVEVEWMGLSPGTRALGILSHGDGEQTFAETELLINTQ
ncbi:MULTISPECIES: S8 family serine peptidase [unclassified Microbulbifer]|uniref:S8 family serine peptidase n=1 Tax=unclassified Microbulbifer TaxID=2619833 RepID=UPI0027E41370|nr:MULTISPECIES: S8 family serine peptidase [unclassified Microbulbifer]